MIRRAQGEARRRGYIDADQIRRAFLDAHNEFIRLYGRSPQYDIVTFRGGFTTAKILFEISEEELTCHTQLDHAPTP